MNCLTVVVLFVVSTVYILVGGSIFYAIEHQNEVATHITAYADYTSFLNNNTCLTDTELQTFVNSIITAYDQGIIKTNTSSNAAQWTFFSSLIFAMTCVTTIGYGNNTPSTDGGRVFTILFALIGIPLNCVSLAGIGLKMSMLLKKFKKTVWFKTYPKVDSVLKLILSELFAVGIFVFVPSAIFSYAENWTYRESVYYCMVTLTTIGFGDYVAAIDDNPSRIPYRLFVALWLVLGLSLVAFNISEATNAYKAFFEKKENKITDKAKELFEVEKKDEEKAEKETENVEEDS